MRDARMPIYGNLTDRKTLEVQRSHGPRCHLKSNGVNNFGDGLEYTTQKGSFISFLLNAPTNFLKDWNLELQG